MKLPSPRRIFLNRRLLGFEVLLLLGVVSALFAHRWYIDREIARLSDELRAQGLPATWPELEAWCGDDHTDNNGLPSTKKRARFREIAFTYPPRPSVGGI